MKKLLSAARRAGHRTLQVNCCCVAVFVVVVVVYQSDGYGTDGNRKILNVLPARIEPRGVYCIKFPTTSSPFFLKYWISSSKFPSPSPSPYILSNSLTFLGNMMLLPLSLFPCWCSSPKPWYSFFSLQHLIFFPIRLDKLPVSSVIHSGSLCPVLSGFSMLEVFYF